jgi:phage regulator Rha-like protein
VTAGGGLHQQKPIGISHENRSAFCGLGISVCEPDFNSSKTHIKRPQNIAGRGFPIPHLDPLRPFKPLVKRRAAAKTDRFFVGSVSVFIRIDVSVPIVYIEYMGRAARTANPIKQKQFLGEPLMPVLIVQKIESNGSEVLVVDSRLIAESLGVGHGPWMTNVVKKYQSEIEQDFGQLHFENGYVNIPNGGRKETVFALLTEDQATCLMTYSKNTEQVRSAKRNLVKQFSKAKQLLREPIAPPAPSRQLAPQRDLKDWIECMQIMGLTEDPILKSLVSQRMAEQIGGVAEPTIALPRILTVRAHELGVSQSEIGTGSQLGKYIVAIGFSPIGKSQHGKYEVNTYEPSEALDDAILGYFDRTPTAPLDGAA